MNRYWVFFCSRRVSEVTSPHLAMTHGVVSGGKRTYIDTRAVCWGGMRKWGDGGELTQMRYYKDSDAMTHRKNVSHSRKWGDVGELRL